MPIPAITTVYSFDKRIVERDCGIFNGVRRDKVIGLLENYRLVNKFDHPSTESMEGFLARLEEGVEEIKGIYF